MNAIYERAFSLLSQAQKLDQPNILDKTVCLNCYKESCVLFRSIVAHESDPAKRQLILQNIEIYESRIVELEFGSLDDCFAESDNCSNPQPLQQNVDILTKEKGNSSEKSSNLLLTQKLQLESDCERLLLDAVSLDEKINCAEQSERLNTIQQCIVAYVKAADCHMSVINFKGIPITELQRNTFSSRLEGILDRLSDLKSGKVATFSSLEHIQKLSDELPATPTLAVLAVNSGTVNSDASIPLSPVSSSHSSQMPISQTIQQPKAGILTDRELFVLKQSSVVNGRIYQPWIPGEEDREVFRFSSPFCDADGLLPLSAIQQKASAIWLRPREIVQLLQQEIKENDAAEQLRLQPLAAVQARQQEEAQFLHVPSSDKGAASTRSINPANDSSAVSSDAVPASPPLPIVQLKPVMIVDNIVSSARITQDLVSDCSFVCSLAITAAFEEKFKRQLVTKIVYPQNGSGMPVYNAYGKYIVRLYINGVQRKVVVDDRLPWDPKNKKLLCSCSRNPTEFWISIIEKAYLKLNGGYDFPGSNSGIDLYCLTGWIPEQIWFSEDAEDADAVKKNSRNKKQVAADSPEKGKFLLYCIP
jgi:hypothetical protein